MFAPDHEATAQELGRIVKPGGRIGLATAWVDFFETNYHSDGEIDHDREWLFVYGTRR